ncbi:valine--tRNA ligase [Candidatus Woesearchaeota archaeon]|nr:valine--tRNA ligase [Candidatus Woesearchaeota archaeon]
MSMSNYNSKESEKKWQEFWEKNKIFSFNKKSKAPIYSIDTPPPTVSGEMHIGHACSYSQQDFIARYKRMSGFNLFFPFGTDDNGLPTERLVEKTYGIKAKDMPRNDFIKLCIDFLKKELPRFVQDWKNIGISCDWDIKYSTIDAHSRKISQWSFLDLYKKGRIYRKDAPAMFCPECKTGVAQVEVHDKERDSMFNDIIFKVGKADIIIATTRPELLPACVAIFYHPGDSRYKHLKGKKASVPLFNFEVPILEDIRADPKKGTGIVMCCTFGDQTDMEWQKAHNLPIKIAITEDGKMKDIAGNYKGLTIRDARKEIIEDLKKNSLLVSQKPIKHVVNVHERCGTEIEFIKSKQWFVKYLDLKQDMLKWGSELVWYPNYMKHRYSNWVRGLQWDWLISNQRYFGVSFPVWYCKKCNEPIIAEEKQLPVDPQKDKPLISKCPKCSSNEFIPENDILNTWFTSSMTPQIAIQLMDKEMQKKLFPMNLRPQAHEIITFWLFNTMIKSRLHFGKNPWKEAAISGFVTLQGEKMSKSKGNIIRPQEVLEKYGADALRFWAASSKLGEDFDYQEKDIVTGQKTIVKLWNAYSFISMHLKDFDHKKPKLEPIDQWLLLKLNSLVKECTGYFDKYEYSFAKSKVENFFWNTFCDYYLEIVKDRLYNPDKRGKESRKSAQYTLYNTFLTTLKLFAPIMPHITEEIYNDYFIKKEKDKSIHISKWPEQDKKLQDKKLEKLGDKFISVIKEIRQFKSKNNKSLKEPVTIVLNNKDLKLFIEDLKAVSNANKIDFGNKFEVSF